jgi:Icc-related predicted phosphoesterase
MKAFVAHTRQVAGALEAELGGLDGADVRIALMHYSPVEVTLRGERLEIYPFLGSYLLAEAIDNAGADIVFHGHAHHGSEKGRTPAGIPVRNVAQPVIRHAYNVYTLGNRELKSVDLLDQSRAIRAGTGTRS